MSERDNKGRFITGNSGRKKGAVGGRTKCVQLLDDMLLEAGNQKKFSKDLQQLFDKSPVDFVYKYGYPLMPKDININADINNIIKVTLEDD